MVVGHTIQDHGIRATCLDQIYCVDVGLSKGCGDGSVQVLEILDDKCVRGGHCIPFRTRRLTGWLAPGQGRQRADHGGNEASRNNAAQAATDSRRNGRAGEAPLRYTFLLKKGLMKKYAA